MPRAYPHSFLILFIRKEGDGEDWDTVVLQRPRTHRTPSPLSFCIVEDWKPFTNHYSDRPLLKGMAYTGPFRGVEVVIKVAYKPVPNAMRRLQHEANAYDKVASLQGFFVPECLGLFTSEPGSSAEYIIGAALPTVYYGNTLMCEVEAGARPADDGWHGMDGFYKRRIIKSVSALHRRGLQLGYIGPECVILDDRLDGSDTDAFIIGLADAAPHKCRQTSSLVHGGLAPQRQEFGCDELYDLCVSLQMWLPTYIFCFAEVFETEFVYPFPWLLAARAPSNAPRADAIKDAFSAIIDYAERYTEDEGDELKGVLAEKREQIIADFVAGKVPQGEEPYGIRSPFRPPAYILYYNRRYNAASVFPYPWLLAAKAPQAVSPADALQEAFTVMIDFAERFAEDGGNELKSVLEKRRNNIFRSFVAGKDPKGPAPYGIRVPLLRAASGELVPSTSTSSDKSTTTNKSNESEGAKTDTSDESRGVSSAALFDSEVVEAPDSPASSVSSDSDEPVDASVCIE